MSIYRGGQWSYYNTLNTLNNLPTNRVHGQGGNLIYYIKTPLYNASNKIQTGAGDDVAAFGQHPACYLQYASSAFASLKALFLPVFRGPRPVTSDAFACLQNTAVLPSCCMLV
jgi:hypothetical protein